MTIVFYIAALIAVYSTVRVITHTNPVHALLYMIVSLLGVAVVIFTMGAPFIAALEVIIYAGAIMVLFVFVAMMLNMGQHNEEQERAWLTPKAWVVPAILCLILLVEMIYISTCDSCEGVQFVQIGPEEVGRSLYTNYIIGVELAAMLLMAGAVGAYHIGRQKQKEYHRYLQDENEN